MKKINLVYFSPTETTKKTLKAIASGFDAEVAEYAYVPKLGQQDLPEFPADELVIVGVPVYGGRIPLVADAFYKSIKGCGPAVAVAVYGNRHYDDALVELEDILTAGGFTVVAGAACVGEHSFGPEVGGGRPDADDLAAAKKFGEDVKAKLAGSATAVSLPGNHEYKARGTGAPIWSPSTNDDCIKCGICVRGCPMGIISAEDPKVVTAPEKCLHCGFCVKKCPKKAKTFAHAEPYQKSMAFLTSNCSARRNPEFYL